jgi:hypothetical protein
MVRMKMRQRRRRKKPGRRKHSMPWKAVLIFIFRVKVGSVTLPHGSSSIMRRKSAEDSRQGVKY